MYGLTSIFGGVDLEPRHVLELDLALEPDRLLARVEVADRAQVRLQDVAHRAQVLRLLRAELGPRESMIQD